jgi:N-acetyl-gamma-glutamyl-phosphate reductase
MLDGRDDLELLRVEEARRKDPQARRERLREADVAVLCLPDEAAREAVAWLEDSDTRVLDASTAHRVADGWIYGLPELAPEQRGTIQRTRRVTNPGCYATAFILAVRPLVDAGLLPVHTVLSIHALSGYSGGGRPLIERWEDPDRGLLTLPFEAPYALERIHKHIPEMVRYARLERSPCFIPAVGPFRAGMRVQVPLAEGLLAPGAGAKRVWEALEARYRGERFVRLAPLADPFGGDEAVFDPRRCNETNRLEIFVVPNPAGHVLLVVLLDNLGKGAAGAAVQNLNLMLGVPEERGLAA